MILSSSFISKIISRDTEGRPSVDKLFNFLKENHLIKLLPNILKHLELEKEKIDKKNTVKLITSHKFSKDIEEKIINKFDLKNTNNDYITEIDQNIIGGFIAQGNNKIFDASIKSNLLYLKEVLLKK